MKNTEPALVSAEEIIEDIALFHDPEKIKDTLDLLIECYLSSHVSDIHSRSKRVDIYTHVNKIKELLDYGKMWYENKLIEG